MFCDTANGDAAEDEANISAQGQNCLTTLSIPTLRMLTLFTLKKMMMVNMKPKFQHRDNIVQHQHDITNDDIIHNDDIIDNDN